ncbi:hypothetical protein NPIL_318301 [Nephila pilipes]|uniref:Uncharacterized protein n=1 Tax=Nephila pilipes TaxID=299642 RepID=A0A8X6U2W5_NEPPI|nr:hypothetical protein NPIL_318301 [Nephila pilipes]
MLPIETGGPRDTNLFLPVAKLLKKTNSERKVGQTRFKRAVGLIRSKEEKFRGNGGRTSLVGMEQNLAGKVEKERLCLPVLFSNRRRAQCGLGGPLDV